ncbi:hypothetical protein AAHE18_15G279200 [Arachis hypogaea]
MTARVMLAADNCDKDFIARRVPIELGISSSICLTLSKQQKVHSLWIKAWYVDWKWVKLGSEEAHLKVSMALEAVFCSRMRWQTWSCDGVAGAEADVDERERIWKVRKRVRARDLDNIEFYSAL